MKEWLLSPLVALAMVASHPQVLGGPLAQNSRHEFFVSPDGSPTNTGTASSPWPSVGVALAHASGGDIITLLPGKYSEAVVVTLSGTAEFPTLIRSLTKWDATIQNSPSHGIYVADGVTNVVIDGLQVAGAAIDGIKVGSVATVRNCWIHQSGGQGITALNTRDTTIEYNLVERNGSHPALDHGMYISGTNLVVRGNVIRWNKTYGCQIYVDPPLSSANCQFYCNLVYGNLDALTVWSPGSQTNYVFNNTLMSGRYVLVADYGTLCVTNNILVGTQSKQILCPEAGARILADYNLMPVAGRQRGPHDRVGVDPGFVNPGAGLFWVRRDSPALGAAARRMPPPSDFFGQSRPTVFSVGAFEYHGWLARDTRVLDPSLGKPDYWLSNLSIRPY